ncbi:MAG: malectin domain-containing carbohydrate-binding protein [Candidatus Eisenbacteria bacterium]
MLCATLVAVLPAAADTILYRVNVGGPSLAALDAGPAWGQDNGASPSPYVNSAQSGNWFGGTDQPMGTPHVSVPAYVPVALFNDERWDLADANDMKWEFPVANGSYRVNLLHGEGCGCAAFVNGRKFDVLCEGTMTFDDYDIVANFGSYKPGMATFLVQVADGSLSLEFRHGPANAPSIRGIEIVAVATSQTLQPSRSAIDFGSEFVDSTSAPEPVTLTHLGSGGDPSISITGASITGPFAHTLTPQVLLPGQTRNFNVTFTPTALGPATGTLTITHSGSNSPIVIGLDGTGANVPPIGFGRSYLQEVVPSYPTTLQFGPDGRLYVGELSGTILVYNVTRSGPNLYYASTAHTINSVKNIPNHDDNGSLNAGETTRLLTGLLVAGTPANPVIYVNSSDPRINVPGLPGLDTNSGILSRLTWNGSSWVKLDLVRGLPRSKNDHASNGLQLDTLTNTLYIAQGGNTNMGAPSNNFSYLPEYALAACILAVDLDAIGNTTYDLPTLNDEDRAGVNDANDPFGGNLGKNQARLVPAGPVQVHSPGFRNPFDVLLASNGKMYSIDNGSNSGWGGPPTGEGPGAGCNNVPNEAGAVSLSDNLHYIPSAGYYAGHPNPTRASVANTFNSSNPQSPVASGNSAECDLLEPGTDGSLASWPFSTNGLCEYRASNLGGALQGDLLATSLSSEVQRIVLNAAGDSAASVATLFTNVGNMPLDITAQGDDGPFPGTIWVCNFGSGLISVYEPSDYDGVISSCTGADDAQLDEDHDGYDNADEIDNGTSPCSAGDVPTDFDADFTSDLNDNDDDNDGLLDTVDAFAIDAANGATPLPVAYSWDAGNPGFGLLGVGFTGLMADSVTDYLGQFDPVQMTAGGAAGKVTIDNVPAGDALGALNDQRYAFQFGVATDSSTPLFLARTRISSPYFNGGLPAGSQSQGFYIGGGSDDDYLKIVATRAGSDPAIEVVHEVNGVPSSTLIAVPGLLAGVEVDLQFLVDPVAATVQPRYAYNGGPFLAAGSPVTLTPGSKLHAAVTGPPAMAVGIIATSRGASPFVATWDFIDVLPASSVGVPGGSAAASTLRLLPARPNPARGAVSMAFELPRVSRVRLSVYDVQGARVRTLADRPFTPGTHALRWDGRDELGRAVANGVYFAQIEMEGARATQRLVMLR